MDGNKFIESVIYESCIKANKSYLDEIIKKVPLSQKNRVEKMFYKHMEQITEYCINNFINTNKLTTTFIKGLHKIHYPPDYTKSIGGRIYLVPGKYKIYENFPGVTPENTKYEMKKLVKDYNNNIEESNNKFDFVLNFIVIFLRIHPFGDGNGRVASILWDLMLIKNNLEPIFYKEIIKNKKYIFEELRKSIAKNDINFFKNAIKKELKLENGCLKT